jgi:hypothetical protein
MKKILILAIAIIALLLIHRKPIVEKLLVRNSRSDRISLNERSRLYNGLVTNANIIDPAFKNMIIDPSYKDMIIDPTYGNKIIDPTFKDMIIDPSYKNKIVDPVYAPLY